MYLGTSPAYMSPDVWKSHMRKATEAFGPIDVHCLTAEELRLNAQHHAAIRMAVQPHRVQPPRAWRQWSGKLLVRLGHRLEGATAPVEADIQPAMR